MGSCDIKIETDHLRQIGFTSLDTIKGRVIINLSSEVTLSSIQVKLIGISRTSLNIKSKQFEKSTNRKEKHLITYETRTILPLKQQQSKEFTLAAGEHEFEYSIKIPLNNSCYDDHKNVHDKNFNIFSKSDPSLYGESFNVPDHKLQTLPPSLEGLYPYASVKYYLKVFLTRTSFLKNSLTIKEKTVKLSQFNGVDHLHRSRVLHFVRKESLFKDKLPEVISVSDLPTSPVLISFPKSASTSPSIVNERPIPRRRSSGFKSLQFGSNEKLSSRSSTSTSLPTLSSPALPPQSKKENHPEKPVTIIAHDISFYFEARSYGLLQTIGEPLALKLFILSKANPKKFLEVDGYTSGLGAIYLKYLHIELITITDIRAKEVSQRLVETKSLQSVETTIKLDLAHTKRSESLNEKTGKPLYEIEVPHSLYQDVIIPSKIPATFKTCNIQRNYKLNITAKFAESHDSPSKSFKTVTLAIGLTMLSGIAPPFASETAPPTALLPSYAEI